MHNNTHSIHASPEAHWKNIETVANKTLFGFDDIFHNLATRAETKGALAAFDFPPTDIYEFENDKWEIHTALAGRTKDSITVEQKENILIISGDKLPKIVEGLKTVKTNGISRRSFRREYILCQYVEVDDVLFNNGLLVIKLVKNIPEEKKPKTFDIK